MTFGIFLLVNLSVAEYLRNHALRKCVDARNTHTVQTAGNLIGSFVELSARVEHCHDYFERRTVLLWMHVDRYSTAVILYDNGVVLTDGHVDMGTVTGQRFVDGVVHCLVNKVVQTLFADVADIHGRTLAYSFQAFENLDVARRIRSGCLPFFFHIGDLIFLSLISEQRYIILVKRTNNLKKNNALLNCFFTLTRL